MKLTYSKIIVGFAAVSALFALSGTSVLADAINPPFIQVDLNGANGPTQPGFVNWPFAAPGAAQLGTTWTTNFATSLFINSNQYTPTGPVTVTIMATNAEAAYVTNTTWYTNFPAWDDQISPNAYDRGSFSGTTNVALLEDFLLVYHGTEVGFGEDYFAVTFSGLTPNTNYEVTVWDYDPSDNGTSGLEDRTSWGIVNPDPGGTNNFQPGQSTIPTLRTVIRGGPYPTRFYGNSGSFIITTDGSGSATIYGWEDDTAYTGSQDVPFNAFSLGFASDTNYAPTTNLITTLNNPVPVSYGPPVVWPYFAGLSMSDSTFSDITFPSDGANGSNTNTIVGETFMPTRDFMLRNFYLYCRSTTNTGSYTFLLYDLGETNVANSSLVLITNASQQNLLSHPNVTPASYWDFSPGGTNALTNNTIVKFKLPSVADEVQLTAGHSYFLGLQFVPGSGSNDLVLQGTGSGLTYPNGAAFTGVSRPVYQRLTHNTGKNLIMAFDVLNPNPVITLSNYPLTSSTHSWPTLSGMANGGLPVITAAMDTPAFDPAQGADPSYLDFTGPSYNNNPVLMSVNLGGGMRCESMSFYNTNTFRLGAVGIEMRGTGSSNLLFTLNVFHITNTFFTSTTTIEHWPRNFQPSTDSDPLGVPIFGTNVNFYFTTNYASTSNQLLVLTLPPQYQEVITGSMTAPYQSYVVELSAGDIGQNAGNVGVFLVVRNSVDSQWQSGLFSGGACSPGFATNAASAGDCIEITPMMLNRPDPDPELYAGGVIGVGTGTERAMQLAIYAAPNTSPATNIVITSIAHSNGNIINWTSSGGSSPTFTVWRTSSLANPLSWTSLQSGISATNYTDTTASGAVNFYRVSSP